jgi:short subunit dehydrogenase-like uncharacterized protein
MATELALMIANGEARVKSGVSTPAHALGEPLADRLAKCSMEFSVQ